MIRTTARGLAGLSVARAYERSDALVERYGSDGFETWKQALKSRLETLGAALSAGDPKMFADDLLWFRGISTSRGIPSEDLLLVLDCMQETLVDQLPGETGPAVKPYFEAAHRALSNAPAISHGLAAGSAAAELFDLAMVGDLGGARRFLFEELQEGRMTLEECIVDALLPAAREAGRRWHMGEMGVAVEHVVTANLRSALHSLAGALPPSAPNGKAAFVAAVPGDAHDTGLVAFALLLEHDGWRVALAGADTPADEIDATAASYDCDVIAISATLPSQRATLSSYLRARDASIPVLVGGAAVRDAADAKTMGADAFATTLADGVRVARELVGLQI
ncbi:cobalamin B12-binding domain-containing protein [Saltatorellus ferox]